MGFPELSGAEYAESYQVSIKFPPFAFGSNQVIGYYNSQELANKVGRVFHDHFIGRIRGGVDIFSEVFLVPSEIIETSFDKGKIQARIDSLVQGEKESDQEEKMSGPEMELRKLGITHFESKESFRADYLGWVLKNHPDKNRNLDATDRFQKMLGYYEAVLEIRGWK